MTAKDTGVFVTDTGAEISVRTIASHTPTERTMIEPLYGTDAELMDGTRGELRGKTGGPLRGTLRRQGNAFALHPEQEQQPEAQLKVLEKAETTSPEAPQPVQRARPTEKTPEPTPVAPPPPRRAKRKEKAPEEAAPLAPPPQPRAEPIEQPQETAPSHGEAMEALKTLARFLAECERQMTARRD